MAAVIWSVLAIVVAVPVGFALTSPLLAWRDPVYIGAGFAGVAALVLLLVQPLLARAFLPGVSVLRGRRVHRVTGGLLVGAVCLHVAGLWITSPPDVIDALLLVSPTPFSVWGVIAMWALFATAVLALWRQRVGLRAWRWGHRALALVIVAGGGVHALLVDGTMEPVSKFILCAGVVVATGSAVAGPGSRRVLTEAVQKLQQIIRLGGR